MKTAILALALCLPSLTFAQTALHNASAEEAERAIKVMRADTEEGSAEKWVPEHAMIMAYGNQLLVPVRLETPDPHRTCALVLVLPDQKKIIIPTYGTGETEAVSCVALKSIGLMDEGDHPTLGLIYEGSVNNHAVTEPQVLRWKQDAYVLDDAAYHYLSQNLKEVTLSGMRTRLAEAKGK